MQQISNYSSIHYYIQVLHGNSWCIYDYNKILVLQNAKLELIKAKKARPELKFRIIKSILKQIDFALFEK